jgi:carbamoyltransferase
MTSFKPATGLHGQQDPSVVLFEDGEAVFGIEEERLTRDKHASDTFPERAIRACLDHRDLELPDVDRVVLPYDPRLRSNILPHYLRDAVEAGSVGQTLSALEDTVVTQFRSRFAPTRQVRHRLADVGTPVPPVETRSPPRLPRRQRVPPVRVRRRARAHRRR